MEKINIKDKNIENFNKYQTNFDKLYNIEEKDNPNVIELIKGIVDFILSKNENKKLNNKLINKIVSRYNRRNSPHEYSKNEIFNNIKNVTSRQTKKVNTKEVNKKIYNIYILRYFIYFYILKNFEKKNKKTGLCDIFTVHELKDIMCYEYKSKSKYKLISNNKLTSNPTKITVQEYQQKFPLFITTKKILIDYIKNHFPEKLKTIIYYLKDSLNNMYIQLTKMNEEKKNLYKKIYDEKKKVYNELIDIYKKFFDINTIFYSLQTIDELEKESINKPTTRQSSTNSRRSSSNNQSTNRQSKQSSTTTKKSNQHVLYPSQKTVNKTVKRLNELGGGSKKSVKK